jgi:hypothetical protein
MAGYRVMLDSRGVNFNLGTKKKPSDLFLAWDQIAAIKHKPSRSPRRGQVKCTGSQVKCTGS